jgi:tetratricopeptide (TPR) repeat protein
MTADYATATLDSLERIPISHGLEWRPIRRLFDLRGFGVNAYSASEVGGQVVEEHTEEQNQHEELYVVVRGRAAFTLDGEEVDAPAVTLVHVPDPAVRRVAVAREPHTIVLALGGKPGEPFRVSAWEAMFAAIPYAQTERWDEAIRLHADALLEDPDNASLLYNLACMEARGGRHLDALHHLQRAVELDPKTAEWARRDSDFAAIRREQGFPA